MTSNASAKVLQSSWIDTTFGEIAEYVTSGSRDWSKYYSDKGALFIRTQDINTNRLRLDDIARVDLPAKVEGKRTRVFKGDILITITGANVGKVALVESDIEEAYVSQSVALVRLKDKSVGKFLHYQLTTKFNGDKTHLEGMAYGLGRPVLNLDNIRNVPVRLAPLDQQKCIVAEIEKQFSRLDEAVANLKRVKANLKRYKAAVLKAAVEGRLVETEAELARREGRNYETGAQLLQHILETRRSQWKGKGKYKEPAVPDTSDLPELPEGWVWATVLQVTDVASGNTPTGILGAVKTTGDVPWFKVGDMNHEENQLVMRHADAWLSIADVRKLGLRMFPPNTVLFPKRGGAIATNKKRRLESVGCADLNVMGITPDGAITAYVFAWFDGVDLASLSDGSNVPQINHKDIEPLLIPFPPLSEQHRIVAEVDRRFSLVRGVESQVDDNLKRAERLRQTILAKSFTGGDWSDTVADTPVSLHGRA